MIDILKRTFVLGIILITITAVCGCTNTNDVESKDKAIANGEVPNIENNTDIENNKDKENNTDINSTDKSDQDSNQMEYFKKLIKLGSYTEIIRLGGEKRDPKDVVIDKKMTFPEGKVVTIISETPGTTKKFVDIGEDKIKELISEIEKSEVVDSLSVNWSNLDTLGTSIEILLLNTSAEYIRVGIDLNTKNNHMFGIMYEEPKISERHFCLQSEKLTEMIKELSGWRAVSNKELEDIVEAKYIDLQYDENKEFELTPDEIKAIVEVISNSKIKPAEYSSLRNIVIEALCSNGETIHMVWSERWEGLGVEGTHYQIGGKHTKILADILNKYSTLPPK